MTHPKLLASYRRKDFGSWLCVVWWHWLLFTTLYFTVFIQHLLYAAISKNKFIFVAQTRLRCVASAHSVVVHMGLFVLLSCWLEDRLVAIWTGNVINRSVCSKQAERAKTHFLTWGLKKIRGRGKYRRVVPNTGPFILKQCFFLQLTSTLCPFCFSLCSVVFVLLQIVSAQQARPSSRNLSSWQLFKPGGYSYSQRCP